MGREKGEGFRMGNTCIPKESKKRKKKKKNCACEKKIKEKIILSRSIPSLKIPSKALFFNF